MRNNGEWLDKLARLIQEHDVNFLGGDFNMSSTQVVDELGTRGITADTCACTPWLHERCAAHGSCLGIDSMALLHIGSGVLCEMPWNFENIGELLKAAACVDGERPQLRHEGSGKGKGKNKPGGSGKGKG